MKPSNFTIFSSIIQSHAMTIIFKKYGKNQLNFNYIFFLFFHRLQTWLEEIFHQIFFFHLREKSFFISNCNNRIYKSFCYYFWGEVMRKYVEVIWGNQIEALSTSSCTKNASQTNFEVASNVSTWIFSFFIRFVSYFSTFDARNHKETLIHLLLEDFRFLRISWLDLVRRLSKYITHFLAAWWTRSAINHFSFSTRSHGSN